MHKLKVDASEQILIKFKERFSHSFRSALRKNSVSIMWTTTVYEMMNIQVICSIRICHMEKYFVMCSPQCRMCVSIGIADSTRTSVLSCTSCSISSRCHVK